MIVIKISKIVTGSLLSDLDFFLIKQVSLISLYMKKCRNFVINTVMISKIAVRIILK